MAFMRKQTYRSGINFLASEVGLIFKTYTGEKSKTTADEDGNYILAAGTIYPANDATAVGIVFEDVDMTYDDARPISLITAGHIFEDALPVAPETTAKTALQAKGIYFEKKNA